MTASTVTVEQAARSLVARAQEVAVCLDFDGTLSPVVDDPQAARPLEGIVELLQPLARRFAAVAIISGRPAPYLAEHLGASGVRYLGLYGLQEVHQGQVSVDPRLEAARPTVAAATAALADSSAVRESGAWLEDKIYSVAVHTRRVPDRDQWADPSTGPPASSQQSKGWSSSRARWSGNCDRRCPATRATAYAGSSRSPAHGPSWSSVTTWATCPRSRRCRSS